MSRTNTRRPLVAALIAAVAVLVLPALAVAADTGPTVLVPNERIMDRISWSAVAAGALVALAIHIALSTLGVGVGAGAIDPYDKHPVKGVPTMVLAWMFVSGLIALFAGGLVAGRLSNTNPFDSAIQGVIVWSFATVILVILTTTSLGYVIGGTFRLLGTGASAVATGVGAVGSAAGSVVSAAGGLAKEVVGDAIPSLNWDNIQREARKALHIGEQGDRQGKQEGGKQDAGKQDAGKQDAGKQEGGNQGGQQKGQHGNNQQGGQQGNQGNNQQGQHGNNQQGNQGGQQRGQQGNNQQNEQGMERQGQGGQGGQSGLQGVWDETQDLIGMLTKAYGAVRDGGLGNADRDSLLTAIRERAGVSEEEANKMLEKWEKMYKEAKQQYDAAVAKAEAKARDAAAAATSAVSRIAVWTFASLILGVTVSAIGGNLGSVWFRL